MGEGGFAFATQHPGDFGDALFSLNALELRDGAPAFDVFADDKLDSSARGDLRQVGDGEDLSLVCDGAHFLANGVGDFAADICVDLVEYEQRDGVLRGEGGFYAAYFRDPEGNKLNAFVMG